MPYYKVDRKLAKRALQLVREDEDRGPGFAPEGEDGIVIDAVITLVAFTNRERTRLADARRPCNLHDTVGRVCSQTTFDHSRAYVYQVVVLRFYNLLSQLAAARQRRLKELRLVTRTRRSLRKEQLRRELEEFQLMG